MGLDFGRTAVSGAAAEPEIVEKYDIAADRQRMNEVYVNSAEVDALTSTIVVDDMETIVTFGAEVAEEISKASDVVLESMNMSQLDDSSDVKYACKDHGKI